MNLQRWLRFCFFNLLLVSILGILLRYKITFSLPFIDQKNILHSHSHFAFTGWITQVLLILMVQYLHQQKIPNAFAKYQWLLFLNLISAYGMLISFILQGYALFSISFSTLSILVSYVFAYTFWKDLKKISNSGIIHHWFKAALLFNTLSSIGAFSLAAFMLLQLTNQHLYLASAYYFLHFQYNGWFFFTCMGLFFQHSKLNHTPQAKNIFWLFALACVPAYFLSILWVAVHPSFHWLIVSAFYVLVVLAALAQTTGWIFFIKLLYKNSILLKTIFSKNAGRLLLLSLIACSIKLLLQQFSVIPFLSKLAFGYRPIVIGYLHLVLLGVITLFLLGYIVSSSFIKMNKTSFIGIGIFVMGIFLNELLLMTQGVAAIGSIWVPYMNEFLFTTALIMFSGLLVLNLTIKNKSAFPSPDKIEI